MKVLITGSEGYIGSALKESLITAGDVVYAADMRQSHKKNPQIHFIRLDITDSKDVREKLGSLDIDVVVHLAALVRGDPAQVMKVNVYGTANLLEALRPHPPRLIIFASTAAQLYRNAQYIPIDENHPITPVTVYGLSKHLAEEVTKFYYRVYSMPTVILRQTNVYGYAPVIKYTVINKFIKDALTTGHITIFGDGRQVRNFIHIDDLIHYYIEIIHYPSPERLAGEIFNISGPEECQIKVLAEKVVSQIALKTGKKIKVLYGPPSIPPDQDIHIFVLSSRKAQLYFNYKPKITLDDGISRTIDSMLSKRR